MAIANLKTPTSAVAPPSTYRGALAVMTTLFSCGGFVTVLNDVLVPHLKSIFDLTYARVMLIQFSFFSAYFIFSIPSAKLNRLDRLSQNHGGGPFHHGLGAFLFIPAARAASYPLFLTALMILAAGITALQVAANPYGGRARTCRDSFEPVEPRAGFQFAGNNHWPLPRRALILTAFR